MRYLKDAELIHYVDKELLPALAEECVAEFHERFGLVLDYSPDSLNSIDALIAGGHPELSDPAMEISLGAYLAAIFSRTDGARWSVSFDRVRGADGYRASRLKLYHQELDVFALARQALAREHAMMELFEKYHRSIRAQA